MKKAILLFCSVFLLWNCAPTTVELQKAAGLDPETEAKISEILKQMTLREKAGQMLNIGLPTILKGDYWSARDRAEFDPVKFRKFIQKVGVGSISKEFFVQCHTISP